jgi:hypothetical protein
MDKKIIDCFPYFDPIDKEKLELRINILKDHVDHFVVCEANRKHNGEAIPFLCQTTIKKLGLPKEKITVIEVDIPSEDGLMLLDLDQRNSHFGNDQNINSVRARARERLQRDSLLDIIGNYTDDTVFICSDSDEIIDPKYINWFSDMVLANPNCLLKVPLVHLHGRADLRVHHEDTGNTMTWDWAMNLCTKQQLLTATPTQLRATVDIPYQVVYASINNQKVEDAGWHFSWMGTSQDRNIKRTSFIHYDDKFDFVKGGGYNNNETKDLDPYEGQISPSGEFNTVLKKYPVDKLPKELFNLPRVKQFFLPGHKTIAEYFKG